MHEYYTLKPQLILKEYGRNIQKLVDYVVKIEDREKRTANAHTLVELMKQINASGGQRDSNESQQKYWDDLYIMSGFSLDVESPFPMPEKEVLGKKPKRMNYSTNHIRYKHYGKNVELMIAQAIEMGDAEKQKDAIIAIGRLMKGFYATWNNDIISDELIIKNIEELSKGKLSLQLDPNQSGSLFEIQTGYKPRHERPNNQNRGRKQNNQNKKHRRNPN